MRIGRRVCLAVYEGGLMMKEKMIRFMQGRYGAYGVDALTKFLMAAGLSVMFISSAFGERTISLACYALGWAAVIYCYFRLFSKNVTKRYAENQAFLSRTSTFRVFFQKQKSMWQQRRVYHIYKCPGCKQKIRIPRGKGKIEVRCPKCSTTFIKKS